jgi:chromosome segregation ATPase
MALAGLLADRSVPDDVPVPVGSLGGFTVSASARRHMTQEPSLILTVDRVPESEMRVATAKLAETALVTRLENRLSGLEHLRDETSAKIERRRAEVAKADDLLARPFQHVEKLAAARNRVDEIGEELKKLATRTSEAKPEAAQVGGGEDPLADRSEHRREWLRRVPEASHPPVVPQPAGRAAGAVAP